MADFTLRCGAVVQVDESDIHSIQGLAWHLDKNGYVVRKSTIAGKRGRTVRLHRVVSGARPGEIVDHIDNVKHNNQRENLRIATKNDNRRNLRKRNDLTSKHKGVALKKATGKWSAQIHLGAKSIHLGTFDIEDEAGHAYNKAAIKHYGEFACLNPIGSDK